MHPFLRVAWAARVAPFLVAALLLLPAASAIPAKGTLTTAKGLVLPPETLLSGAGMGFYLGSLHATLPLESLVIRAEQLKVTEYAIHFIEADAPGLPYPAGAERGRDEPRERVLNNVTLTLDGGLQYGYVAVESSPLDSTLRLFSTSSSELQGLDSTTWRFTPGVEETRSDRDDGYARVLHGSHVAVSASGLIELDGKAKLKLLGMTLAVTSDEGSTIFRTGDFWETETPVRERTTRWITIHSDSLALAATADAPWLAAASEIDASWEGTATLKSASGRLTSDSAAYDAVRSDVHLTGSFVSGIFPVPKDDEVNTLVRLDGDLHDTSLRAVATQRAPIGSQSIWPLLLVGIALVAGGSTVGMLLFRGGAKKSDPPVGQDTGTGALPLNAPPQMTAEYYVGLAEQALQFEDHVKALHWITLARQTAPTSAHVATTMAYVLGELGHYEEALEAYEEASRLDGTDGEADLNAARLACQAGQPVEVVERFLLRALERSPEHVVDVEDDPELRLVMERPAVRKGIRAAWDRWGNGERAR